MARNSTSLAGIFHGSGWLTLRREDSGRAFKDVIREGQRTIQISKLLPDQETLPFRMRTNGSEITRVAPGKGAWKRTARWVKNVPKYGSFSREDQISFLTTIPGMNERKCPTVSKSSTNRSQ